MRTIALVAGIPALVAAVITLAAVLNAPSWVIWPLVIATIVAVVALLGYYRWKNWLIYVLVTSAAGALVRGGLGITFDLKGRIAGQLPAQVDGIPAEAGGIVNLLFTTSSDAVSIVLIIAGLILFGLAVFLHLVTRKDALSKPASQALATEPSDSTVVTVATGVSALAGVALAVTAAPVSGAVVAVVGISGLIWNSLSNSSSKD